MATQKGKKGAEVDLADLITQKEAAELRGVSLAAIANLVKRGRLSKFKQFGRSLVSRREVEALEDKRGWPKGKARKGDN
jgi:fatty acid-binding protein DegV